MRLIIGATIGVISACEMSLTVSFTRDPGGFTTYLVVAITNKGKLVGAPDPRIDVVHDVRGCVNGRFVVHVEPNEHLQVVTECQ